MITLLHCENDAHSCSYTAFSETMLLLNFTCIHSVHGGCCLWQIDCACSLYKKYCSLLLTCHLIITSFQAWCNAINYFFSKIARMHEDSSHVTIPYAFTKLTPPLSLLPSAQTVEEPILIRLININVCILNFGLCVCTTPVGAFVKTEQNTKI